MSAPDRCLICAAMSFSVAVVIATFILTTTAIGLLVLISSRQRAAQEAELKRAAAARGWQFESMLDRGYRVHRWTGTTDGVGWRAESLRSTSGGNRPHRRRSIARWHCDFSPGINAPIVCMGVPEGKELHSVELKESEGVIGKLAQKAIGFAFDTAIDMYFGKALGQEVDAGAMRRVETTLPGFIVMAASKDEGARILGARSRAVALGRDPRSALGLLEGRPAVDPAPGQGPVAGADGAVQRSRGDRPLHSSRGRADPQLEVRAALYVVPQGSRGSRGSRSSTASFCCGTWFEEPLAPRWNVALGTIGTLWNLWNP